MVKIMRGVNSTKRRVVEMIMVKQAGLCRFCKLVISATDEVVSRGKMKKYYYKHCAEKLKII